MRAYSPDLRSRVIAHTSRGNSQTSAADHFDISLSTVDFTTKKRVPTRPRNGWVNP